MAKSTYSQRETSHPMDPIPSGQQQQKKKEKKKKCLHWIMVASKRLVEARSIWCSFRLCDDSFFSDRCCCCREYNFFGSSMCSNERASACTHTHIRTGISKSILFAMLFVCCCYWWWYWSVLYTVPTLCVGFSQYRLYSRTIGIILGIIHFISWTNKEKTRRRSSNEMKMLLFYCSLCKIGRKFIQTQFAWCPVVIQITHFIQLVPKHEHTFTAICIDILLIKEATTMNQM